MRFPQTTGSMAFKHRSRAALLIAAVFLIAGCRALEVAQLDFAIINVPVSETATGYATAPVAFFFRGSGVQLPSTNVNQEGCVTLTISNQGNVQDLDYINAGSPVVATLSGNSGSLTPRTAGDRTTYELDAGTEIEFTPGATISVAIPGASGGFPTLVVTARTSEFFQADAVTVPSAGDMVVTWTPPTLTGTAMFYSFRYAWSGSTTENRELACVFRDDGSGTVPEGNLTEFRQATVRSIQSQRGTATTERIGDAVTHVLSTVEVQVPLITP